MLSPLLAREVAHKFEEGRRLLLAKVVVSMRYDPDNKSGIAQMEYLQRQFEALVHSLPLWLRSERVLSKRLVEPAERRLSREGVLSIAQQMREWSL